MASLIAAVTHDLDHPGVNQPFLVATSNHLAALYEVCVVFFLCCLGLKRVKVVLERLVFIGWWVDDAVDNLANFMMGLV